MGKRVTALETEHKHLATKADLEQGLSGLRTELHATETRLRKEITDSETRLRKEVQENKEELSKQIQGVKDDLQAEMRQLPFRLVTWLAGLAALVGAIVGAVQFLLGQ